MNHRVSASKSTGLCLYAWQPIRLKWRGFPGRKGFRVVYFQTPAYKAMASEEEIRALCARVVKAQGREFEDAISELQAALEARFSRGDESVGDERG